MHLLVSALMENISSMMFTAPNNEIYVKVILNLRVSCL